MAQVTTGLRRLLSSPHVYDLLQSLLGGAAARREINDLYFKAALGQVIVDVGCGTAEVLDFLPTGVVYHGFDLEPAYIDAARSRYGNRGSFHCRDITTLRRDELPPSDLTILFGVLHHLDDADATRLIDELHERLAPAGRLVTIDPALEPGQSWFARAMINRDRGQNVRSGSGYVQLVSAPFSAKRLTVRHDLLRVPYTHAIMECIK